MEKENTYHFHTHETPLEVARHEVLEQLYLLANRTVDDAEYTFNPGAGWHHRQPPWKTKITLKHQVKLHNELSEQWGMDEGHWIFETEE